MKTFTSLLSLLTSAVCVITILILFSCSPGKWKVGQGDKLSNMKQWKVDKQEKRDAKKARQTAELVNR